MTTAKDQRAIRVIDTGRRHTAGASTSGDDAALENLLGLSSEEIKNIVDRQKEAWRRLLIIRKRRHWFRDLLGALSEPEAVPKRLVFLSGKDRSGDHVAKVMYANGSIREYFGGSTVWHVRGTGMQADWERWIAARVRAALHEIDLNKNRRHGSGL